MKKFIMPLLAAIFCISINADEGMWMLNRIDPKTAEVMKGLGLSLTPQQLYNPDGESLKDAVVDLCDFCSGVVVSPQGLMLTNHHCGYRAIQALSTPEDDILKNGFVAHSLGEERPAPGYFVRFLQRTEDCTERVMSEFAKVSEQHGGKLSLAEIEANYTDSICIALEKEFSKANGDMDCSIASFYSGNAYYVSYYKVYRDVRLVFTGTETLGKFGGDTDNWMWPRQTCDFSMFRIYADKDGNPAEYSPDNVPLSTPGYAPVSLEGYKPGDYCMTIGYPGSTDRYLSSWGIIERAEAQNQAVIDVRTAKQNVWKHWMDSDRAIAIKYASKWASSSNYWKNSIGMNKAIKDLDIVGHKKVIEQGIRDWYSKDAELSERFKDVLPTLEQAYTARKETRAVAIYFSEVFMRGIELHRIASRLSRLPHDANADDVALCISDLKAIYKDYDPRLDQETMGTLLTKYREWTKGQYLPAFYSRIDSIYGGDCMAYAKDVFSKTCVLDTTCVGRIVSDSTLRQTDPAIIYADDVMTTFYDIANCLKNSYTTINYNERMLTQALLEMDQERPHYSDANFTMRLSYGYIQDYTAGGTHYDYFTDSQSLLDKAAKQHEIEDYELEDNIVALLKKGKFGRYADKETGKMQLCFLSNNDITGGNSGSPMFDGQGRVIGLAFDGNWEAMAGDISFDASLQRCIGVDIRFVLWVIDQWGGGKEIIKELDKARKARK